MPFTIRAPQGITVRITLLGWLVTLATLGVFVMVIVPEQKREFSLGLESKARGVAASIRAVASGAAVSEDYSVVVDQAMQVLAGDPAIDFLIITKNDGFSVIIDHESWKTDKLETFWRPPNRHTSAAIAVVPLFGRRVFHYATPFDYSGIQWGWIHVGLSLATYDESVARNFRRTSTLSLLCVCMSLFFSTVYARRLVKPIHTLHAAVKEVWQGNLHARADVRSRDEIEQVATAFNAMTGTIMARNQTLESVAFAAQQLMGATDWTAVIGDVLERIGRVTGTSRACLFQIHEGDGFACILRREWLSSRFNGFSGRWRDVLWQNHRLTATGKKLKARLVVTANRSDLAEATGELFDASIQSFVLIPIFVSEAWWGFLCFTDSSEGREWGDAEKSSLGAVANMLGASIVRQQAQEDLLDAKATLERRVQQRTQELQKQVAAKDAAHAELAAAQQRLIELSRQAGMAEVATGVLHNVGNVLNSVNVAATIVVEKLRQSRVDRLLSLAGLLQQHQNDLGTFVSSDPKGAQVVPYLVKLASHLGQEREGMVGELGQLHRHIGHIKEIVAAQQGYATTAGFIQRVSLNSLLEDALTISKNGLEREDVAVCRHFDDLPPITTDKHKVLQIVLNLVRNARDAVRVSGKANKEIHVYLRRLRTDSCEIAVRDNGVGLAMTDVQRIFQHGFTTKEGGHGFGLHSGALAAIDLGGKLTATSDGPGTGATFTLELPLTAPPIEAAGASGQESVLQT
jgi:signal transduction histidine kinase